MERAKACRWRNHRRQKPGGWLSVLAFRVCGTLGGNGLGGGNALKGSRGRCQLSSLDEVVLHEDRLEDGNEDVVNPRHDLGPADGRRRR